MIGAGDVLELDGAGRILGHDMEVKWSIVEVRDRWSSGAGLATATRTDGQQTDRQTAHRRCNPTSLVDKENPNRSVAAVDETRVNSCNL